MKDLAQRYAKVIVVIAVLCGSTSGIIGKLITANAMAIGFYRLSMALPFFILPVFLGKRHELKALCRRDLIWSLVSGMFLFFHFFCWFTAVKSTTVASAIILADLHPIIVMLITVVVLGKKIPGAAAFGVFVALLGGGIILGFDIRFSTNHLSGDLFAIATAIAMGVYFSIGGVLRKRIPADIYIMLVFSSCWVCFTLGMLFTKTPFLGYPRMDYLWLIAMTLLCQLGAHAVLNWSMGFVSALYVSAWETGEIVSASALAMVVLNETPGLSKVLGGVIVICGLLYYNRHESDQPLEPNKV